MATRARAPTAARLLLTAVLVASMALVPVATGLPQGIHLSTPDLPRADEAALDPSASFVPNPHGCLAAPPPGTCTFDCDVTRPALVLVAGPPGAAVTATCSAGLSVTCTATASSPVCLLDFTGSNQGFDGAGTCSANALAVLAGCGSPVP